MSARDQAAPEEKNPPGTGRRLRRVSGRLDAAKPRRASSAGLGPPSSLRRRCQDATYRPSDSHSGGSQYGRLSRASASSAKRPETAERRARPQRRRHRRGRFPRLAEKAEEAGGALIG